MAGQTQQSAPAQTPTPAQDGPSQAGPTQAGPSAAQSNERAQARLAPGASPAGGGGAANPAGGGTVSRGGGNYTIASGDTLRKISKDRYGFEGYWDKIRDANPTRIFDNGKCFLVGDVITTPAIDVPTDVAAGPEVPVGGLDIAARPKRENTDWGTYLIYPDAYQVTPLPAVDGERAIHRTDYKLEIQTKEEQARAQMVSSQDEIDERLDYGVFDWAVTDADATEALNGVAARPYSMIPASIAAMGQTRFTRLLENLPDAAKSTVAWAKVGAATDQIAGATELKAAFDRLPNEEILAMQALMTKRFRVEVGGKKGNSWTAAALRRLWGILERLPPGAVEGNACLDAILRDNGSAGGGYYSAGNRQAVVGYGANLNETGSYGEVLVDDGAGGQKDAGLHSNVNLFDTVVRHEIGHAVDARIGASRGYATTAANAGEWRTYASPSAFVDGLIAEGGDLGTDAKGTAWKQAMIKAVTDVKGVNEALAELKTAGTVPADTPEVDASAPASIQGLLTTSLWAASASPWYGSTQGAVGTRRFHQSYGGSRYVSYKAEAREKYGVSGYQFRAPGEWFAEAYACYYSDHPDVNGKDVGTRLRTRDSATATWMDTNVNSGPNSLAQASGGAGGSSSPSAQADGGMGTQDSAPASS